MFLVDLICILGVWFQVVMTPVILKKAYRVATRLVMGESVALIEYGVHG